MGAEGAAEMRGLRVHVHEVSLRLDLSLSERQQGGWGATEEQGLDTKLALSFALD